MSISRQELEKIARLAHLRVDPQDESQLVEEINAIMDFVDELRTQNTDGVAPLFHPLSLHQRLRNDAITEADCVAELEAMAPLFKDQLYMVPKVIEGN